jgi:hypothetical protein
VVAATLGPLSLALGNTITIHVADKYIYGRKISDVTPAAGTKGVLCRSGTTFFFRVYEANGEFIDYKILHDDLSITIDQDELAAFYHSDENTILDHSPNVLGLKRAK